MNMSFYSGAVGAQQQQRRLSVQGNNIANVNTHGYKAEKAVFATLMHRDITGIDNARLPAGTGARVEATPSDFSAGAMVGTTRGQSYAIDGSGFFALVEMGSGEVSYTRDGTFSLSQVTRQGEDGEPEEVFYLSDGEGRLVLSRLGAPIVVSDSAAEQEVGVFDFVNRDGMPHVGANRFVPGEKNGQVRLGAGTAQFGVLEASNTDLAVEMAKIIEAQRSYSYALKMVQTSDEIESTINGLRT